MKRPTISGIVVGLFLVAVGVQLGQATSSTVVVPVRDTVTASYYSKVVRDLRLANTGLRARLEGVHAVQPERILVVDTLYAPPDTVLRFVRVENDRLAVENLITVSDVTPNADSVAGANVRVRPELHAGFDISRCDDGFEVSAAGVICDPARFGHLYVGGVVSKDPALGLWWEPAYRSPWELYVSRTNEEWWFGLRYGVRLW